MNAVARLVSLVWATLTLPLSTTLLVVAVTWEGRAFAVALLTAGTGLLVISYGRSRSRRGRGLMAVVLGALALISIVFVAWRVPSGDSPRIARVQHLYLAGGHHGRFGIANLVPEIDQLMMGFTLMPFADPLFTQRQAKPLKRWTQEIYRELENDAEFRALGSAMSGAYLDLCGAAAPAHAFLYVPSTRDRSRAGPVLVFLHGSGGNFKAYLWLLSRLADRLNMIVVAPSCGMGNWTQMETSEKVEASLAAVAGTVAIDAANVHVIGLSNGGVGVTQLLSSSPGRFRSFVFLSPVFHDRALQSLLLVPGERKPSVLIVTGRRDDRVPLPYVEGAVKSLRRNGADVTLEAIEEANHFLFFSHRDLLLHSLQRWLAGYSGDTASPVRCGQWCGRWLRGAKPAKPSHA